MKKGRLWDAERLKPGYIDKKDELTGDDCRASKFSNQATVSKAMGHPGTIEEMNDSNWGG